MFAGVNSDTTALKLEFVNTGVASSYFTTITSLYWKTLKPLSTLTFIYQTTNAFIRLNTIGLIKIVRYIHIFENKIDTLILLRSFNAYHQEALIGESWKISEKLNF